MPRNNSSQLSKPPNIATVFREFGSWTAKVGALFLFQPVKKLLVNIKTERKTKVGIDIGQFLRVKKCQNGKELEREIKCWGWHNISDFLEQFPEGWDFWKKQLIGTWAVDPADDEGNIPFGSLGVYGLTETKEKIRVWFFARSSILVKEFTYSVDEKGLMYVDCDDLF